MKNTNYIIATPKTFKYKKENRNALRSLIESYTDRPENKLGNLTGLDLVVLLDCSGSSWPNATDLTVIASTIGKMATDAGARVEIAGFRCSDTDIDKQSITVLSPFDSFDLGADHILDVYDCKNYGSAAVAMDYAVDRLKEVATPASTGMVLVVSDFDEVYCEIPDSTQHFLDAAKKVQGKGIKLGALVFKTPLQNCKRMLDDMNIPTVLWTIEHRADDDTVKLAAGAGRHLLTSVAAEVQATTGKAAYQAPHKQTFEKAAEQTAAAPSVDKKPAAEQAAGKNQSPNPIRLVTETLTPMADAVKYKPYIANVAKQSKLGKLTNTDIIILVDCGSNTYPSAKHIAVATATIGNMAVAAGANVSVMAYHDADTQLTMPEEVHTILPFEHFGLDDVLVDLNCVRGSRRGLVLEYATEVLLQRGAKTKEVILITDFAPYDSDNVLMTSKAIQTAQNNGIEVCALVFQYDEKTENRIPKELKKSATFIWPARDEMRYDCNVVDGAKQAGTRFLLPLAPWNKPHPTTDKAVPHAADVAKVILDGAKGLFKELKRSKTLVMLDCSSESQPYARMMSVVAATIAKYAENSGGDVSIVKYNTLDDGDTNIEVITPFNGATAVAAKLKALKCRNIARQDEALLYAIRELDKFYLDKSVSEKRAIFVSGFVNVGNGEQERKNPEFYNEMLAEAYSHDIKINAIILPVHGDSFKPFASIPHCINGADRWPVTNEKPESEEDELASLVRETHGALNVVLSGQHLPRPEPEEPKTETSMSKAPETQNAKPEYVNVTYHLNGSPGSKHTTCVSGGGYLEVLRGFVSAVCNQHSGETVTILSADVTDTPPHKLITIDGPSSVGKTTQAKRLAKKLGYRYVDIRLLYESVAYVCHEKGISPDKAVEFLQNKEDPLTVRWGNGDAMFDTMRVLFPASFRHGPSFYEFVNNANDKVDMMEHCIVAREFVVDTVRSLLADNDIIVEGRDTGSALFPDADVKFYLSADMFIRAYRNHGHGYLNSFTGQQILENLEHADSVDRDRKVGGLKKTSDAFMVDSSDLSINETTETLLKLASQKLDIKNV